MGDHEGRQVSAASGPRGPFVIVRISPTIASEYASRCPEDIPDDACSPGKVKVSLRDALLMLADAEFNSDTQAFEIGDHGMPLPIFNAYRALAKQLRGVIEQATSLSFKLRHDSREFRAAFRAAGEQSGIPAEQLGYVGTDAQGAHHFQQWGNPVPIIVK